MRLIKLWIIKTLFKFQSTHPHGVRLNSLRCRKVRECFNPRTHTGCDVGISLFVFPLRVSIHAPTRGATLQTFIVNQYELFQSTHPHGVRPFRPTINAAKSRVSIHAPTRGATYSGYNGNYVYSVSIHAPTRGATRHGGQNSTKSVFQSTHPHGVRQSPS